MCFLYEASHFFHSFLKLNPLSLAGWAGSEEILIKKREHAQKHKRAAPPMSPFSGFPGTMSTK